MQGLNRSALFPAFPAGGEATEEAEEQVCAANRFDPIVYLRREKYGERAGVRALKAFGRTAAEPLVSAFTGAPDRDNVVFLAKVAEVLGEAGDPIAVEPLIRALSHAGIGVRSKAATALGKIRDPRVVDPLISSFRTDRHPMVRNHAAEALGRLKARSAVPPLLDGLKEAGVREQAAKALREIDPAGALEAIHAAMAADPARSSGWAIPALEHLGDGAVEPLLGYLSGAGPETRRRAVAVLRNLLARGSGKRAEIVESLIRFFESGAGELLRP